MRRNLFFLVLFVMATWCISSAAVAHAEDAVPPNIDTAAFYDETSYDWPGSPRRELPFIDTVTAGPGRSVSPIMPFGDFVYVDNQSAQPARLSFKTPAEWRELKVAPPDYLAFVAGCPRLPVENPCKAAPKTITPGRVGAIKTLVFGEYFTQIYECVAVSGRLSGQWMLIGYNQIGNCPE